jgi:hypothetical protein
MVLSTTLNVLKKLTMNIFVTDDFDDFMKIAGNLPTVRALFIRPGMG